MNLVPQPIDDRIGHTGGIETLVLDGHTYFFGFDYSSDLVISPLINNIDVMAQFASRYMEQRDGLHDEAYWREMAEESIGSSELSDSLRSRSFSCEQLTAAVASISQAALDSNPVNELEIGSHLLYLLGSAGGWLAPPMHDLIACVSGKEEPPSDSRLNVVANELLDALRQLIDLAPGNWATYFSCLRPS